MQQETTLYEQNITKLLNIFNIQDTMHLNKSKFGQSLRQSLVNKYLLDWQRSNDVLKDSKLVTYLFLKTNFGLEKYLTLINNFNYRKSICRFRVSAHRLYIETGRYKHILINERLCKNCSANEIEDEAHLLIKCDKLNNKREELFHQK
jgi:superfamily II helicase